jgi:hypothetical protein
MLSLYLFVHAQEKIEDYPVAVNWDRLDSVLDNDYLYAENLPDQIFSEVCDLHLHLFKHSGKFRVGNYRQHILFDWMTYYYYRISRSAIDVDKSKLIDDATAHIIELFDLYDQVRIFVDTRRFTENSKHNFIKHILEELSRHNVSIIEIQN